MTTHHLSILDALRFVRPLIQFAPILERQLGDSIDDGPSRGRSYLPMSVIEAISHVRIDLHWRERLWRSCIVSFMGGLSLKVFKQKISKAKM